MSANVKVDLETEAPFSLAMGDRYYEHKETGVEIRLYRINSKAGPAPEKILVEGADKHGNPYNLTARELFDHYTQKVQSDFTDPVDPRLPYSFDLFYDIKTVSQLKQYIEEEGLPAYLQKLMDNHDVVL